MEDTEKLIKNYTEYMTLSVLPENVIRQFSISQSGSELLKKGHEFLQNGEAQKAVECYRKAAEKGETDSCFALSICYEYGIGVPTDPKQAAALFERAAKLRRQGIYDLMGAGAYDTKKDQVRVKKDKINRMAPGIFFPNEGRSKIKRIVFGRKISAQAFSGDYKDFSADRDGSVIGWMEDTTLHIEADGKVTAPTDCSHLFESMNMESILCNDAFDTSQVTDMRCMFAFCKNLVTVDLSGVDTGRVTVMRSIFYGCETLKELDLSSFDMRRVTDAKAMFAFCRKLEKLNMDESYLGKAADKKGMFDCCYSLPFQFRKKFGIW